MTDSEKIKHIREMLKLTQQEFAAKLNVSQGSITSLEKGRNKEMSLTVFKNLVNEFGVNPYFFLSNRNEPEFSDSTADKRKKISKYEELIDQLYDIRLGFKK